LLRIGRHRLALVAFQQAARLGDNSLVTSKNLGLLHLGFQNFSQAVEPFQRVLELDPNDFQSHLFLALAFDVQENPTAAASHLAKARRISPEEVTRQAGQREDLSALVKKYP
jgi:tetratricopeptide (TPR) repeat protein